MRRLAVAVAAIAVLAIGAAVVQAAIPDADGYTYICVNKANGAMSAREKGDGCKNNEKASRVVSTQAAIPNITTYVKQKTVAIPQGVVAVTTVVRCDTGDVATGGGTREGTSGVGVTDSRPADTPGSDSGTVFDNDGWEAKGTKAPGQPPFTGIFFIYVVCQHTA
jgi:hypothetical protein